MTTTERSYIQVAKPLIGEEEKRAVMEVLDSGQLAQGSRTEGFEQAFAEYIGTKHAIGVNSGTAALIVALQAHGVGPGDEVITTPFSFIATATSIIACGATPVFVDIDPFDLNMDPNQLEDAITDNTKAVMPVHLFGHPARMTEIAQICEDNELALVEDAAQAHGAEHQGTRAGAFGTGCFSFYPTKNMTTGEGGIITTNDDEVARLCRIIRSHGQEQALRPRVLRPQLADAGRERRHRVGRNSGTWKGWNKARIANAEALSRLIRSVETPKVREGDRHVFHQFTVRVGKDRDGGCRSGPLQEAGVGSAVHYPIPIHQQPIIQKMGFGEGSFPVAEAAAEHVLALPVHPMLGPEDVEYIAATVNRLA